VQLSVAAPVWILSFGITDSTFWKYDQHNNFMYNVVSVTPVFLIKFLLPGSPCLLVLPGHHTPDHLRCTKNTLMLR